jgi:hypothetical protein
VGRLAAINTAVSQGYQISLDERSFFLTNNTGGMKLLASECIGNLVLKIGTANRSIKAP